MIYYKSTKEDSIFKYYKVEDEDPTIFGGMYNQDVWLYMDDEHKWRKSEFMKNTNFGDKRLFTKITESDMLLEML